LADSHIFIPRAQRIALYAWNDLKHKSLDEDERRVLEIKYGPLIQKIPTSYVAFFLVEFINTASIYGERQAEEFPIKTSKLTASESHKKTA
jgi:hypothetical protein